MVCISLAACSATADCVTFPGAKALLCYFRVQCPFCLPNVLFWETATQHPVYYNCLEWVYRSCLPEWARCGPLLPCGPVGCVIKNEDTGSYRSSYKTLVLRGIHCCDKLSVWLQGQCSFQFLLMENQMVSSIEFRCWWNCWIRLCGNAFRVLATYPEGGWEFTGTESSVFHVFIIK